MKKENFEESLKRLEEITEKLEKGELSLDESLKIFEEGIKLSRFCQKKLTEAEQKVEILKSTDVEDSQTEDPLIEDSLTENQSDDEENIIDMDIYQEDVKHQVKKKKKKSIEENDDESGKSLFEQ